MNDARQIWINALKIKREVYWEFKRIFGVEPDRWWINNWCGFDVILFDKEWVKTPRGISMVNYVGRTYGPKAVEIIKRLCDS